MVGDSFLPARKMVFSGDKIWSAGHCMVFQIFSSYIYIFYAWGLVSKKKKYALISQ